MSVRIKRVRLRNCPPGLFWFGSTLGFKSEYSSNENAMAGGGGDAYVVESGEYFWGGASTFAERGDLMVTPVRWAEPAPVARERSDTGRRRRQNVTDPGIATPSLPLKEQDDG